MDAATLLTRLAEVIDAHDWEGLPALLHPDFTCRLVHTGEVFDRDGWVRLNADYPGFQRMLLEDLVADGDRGVLRATVTGTSAAGERAGLRGRQLRHRPRRSHRRADRGLGRRRPGGSRGHAAVSLRRARRRSTALLGRGRPRPSSGSLVDHGLAVTGWRRFPPLAIVSADVSWHLAEMSSCAGLVLS